MITLDLSILNQKGTPMFYSDLTANIPAAGITGRIFIATDSPYGLFRDTGSAWEQIAGSGGGGGGNTIYTANDTLTGNRVVSSGGFSLTINPSTTFATTLTAAIGSGAVSAFGVNTLSYAAGFSSSNLGSVYGAIGGINFQTFAGSATFSNSNLAAANVGVNSVDFSSAGSTITMTQATGLRVMAGHQNQFQYQGTNSGTITHAATSQNLGFYRPPSATGILTITNAYGFLLNDLNDYGAGFTFTNRWGIYQAGANDINFLNASLLIGTSVNAGFKLDVNGTARVSGDLLVTGTIGQRGITVGGSSLSDTRVNIDATSQSGIFFKINGVEKHQLVGVNGGLYVKNSTFGIITTWLENNILFTDLSTGGSTPFSSAAVEVRSIQRGFLPPRMTTAQINAIASPANGLMAYNTTIDHMCVYQAGAWQRLNNSPM